MSYKEASLLAGVLELFPQLLELVIPHVSIPQHIY